MENSISDWLSDVCGQVIEEDKPTKKKKKESTLTLAMELPAMDYRNKDFYKNLTEEQKKEISLWLLMRFMSSSQGDKEHHLLMVNELVNHNFTLISKHPELQWMLLSICGTHKKQFHPWIAPPKGMKKNKLEEHVLILYPKLKDDELDLFFRINSNEDIKDMFIKAGYDDKTISELFKDKS